MNLFINKDYIDYKVGDEVAFNSKGELIKLNDNNVKLGNITKIIGKNINDKIEVNIMLQTKRNK